MPHNAINIYGRITNGTFQLYTSVNNAPWAPGPISMNRVWRGERIVRPKSTNNPLRDDKTRPPSGWVASGGRLSSGESFAEIQTANPAIRQRVQGMYQPKDINNLGNVPVIDPGLRVRNSLACLSQLTERTQELSTALREAGKTAKMVGNAATGFAKGLDALCQRKNPVPMRNWKKLPGWYLEYLYGWKPMSEDLANGFSKLADLHAVGLNYQFTLRRRAKARKSESSSVNGYNSSYMCREDSTIQQIEHCSYTFALPSWFLEQTPVIAPWTTLHEGIGYSFVLDWFLPIGNWLGSMESMQFAPYFKEGSESSLNLRTFDEARFSQEDNAFTYLSRGPIPFGGSDYKYTRSVVTTLASVAFRFPDLRSTLNLDKAAQGLALLTQVFKKWS